MDALPHSYREVPYVTLPMAQTHPDRLASVATLLGMSPAPVAACRVLEVGCGSGGNLIPMAYFLPGSRFTGVDLEEAAIAEGRRAAEEVGLHNLDLIAMDLRDIGPAMGEFDYIVAHGLYSWIPQDIRDRLLAVCRQRLAPHGVACISYNCLPGRHLRIMLREMMMYRTRHCANENDRIQQARGLLQTVGESQLYPQSWRSMMDEQIEQLLKLKSGWLLHDDLASVNDSFYVHEFVKLAAGHSLQYLGDAETQFLFPAENPIDGLSGDAIEREQYLDFLHLRQFRNTLLCRQEVPLQRTPGTEWMEQFHFSSRARRSEEIEGLTSQSIDSKWPAVRVSAAMRQVYPRAIAFDELLKYAGDRETLYGILLASIRQERAQFHVHDFASGTSANSRPMASRLARWENGRSGVVTYPNHTVLKLDGIVSTLLEVLDGTREFEQIVAALAQVADAPGAGEIRARLPEILAHMADAGLLSEQGGRP